MTARKLPPAGRPLRSFFILGAPQPPPSKGDLREVPLRGKGSRPPPRKTGRVSHSPGAACPCRGLGNRPAGLGLFQGELENALPSKGDLREVPLRGRDKLLVPEENGEGPVP